MNVVRLPANDTARGWASGDAICIGCKHEWIQVSPVGSRWLECPACSSNKGIYKQPFGADEGDSVFRCSYCDSEALTAFYRRDLFYLMCMSCGVDHTTAIFEGK
jgi:DNA-directed RNA polymerase subunit RPC12/RpoP